MATKQASRDSFVEQGVDRVQEAVRSLDKEFQRIQKQFRTRTRSLEKRLDTQRKAFEKRAQKQIRGAQKQLRGLRKAPVLKRAEELGNDAARQLESGVETVLGAFQIASKADLQRVDRKISKLNKRLKEIEKANNESAGS